jgi:hypothetical protein
VYTSAVPYTCHLITETNSQQSPPAAVPAHALFTGSSFILLYIASSGCLLKMSSVFEVAIIMNHISVEMLEDVVELFAMHRYDPERPHGVLSCACLCFVLLTRKPDVLNSRWVVTGG